MLRQGPLLSRLEVAERHGADRDAREADYLAADCFEHPPHLAVASLDDGHLDDRLSSRLADARDQRGSGRPVFELHAVTQQLELLLAKVRRRLHDVGLRNLVLGVGHPLGEDSVVRQNEKSARVEVEPSDREEVSVAVGE